MNNNRKIEYEVVPHRKLKHVHIFLTDITRCGVHMHNEVEVFAVIGGKGNAYVNGNSIALRPGSVLLFNSNETHGIEGDGGSVIAVVIQISGNFMQDYFPQLHNAVFEKSLACENAVEDPEKKLWRCLISAARNYIASEERYELRCVSDICRLIDHLMAKLPFSIISENDYQARRNISQRMSRIVSYIDANYQFPVRLADVAETEGVTSTHLSHFFTDNFGMSFQQYLNNIRFEHALRLMDNSAMSIADVAAASGFSDTKYLTRICVDRYECKPRELREKRASGEIAAINGEGVENERSYTDEHSMKMLDEFVHGFEI